VNRVAVLGPGGAGKSELSRKLAERTGLPLVYLDRLYWRPGWKPAPRDEFRRALDDAVAGERWIIDGNFLSAGDARVERAVTVVLLDHPRALCHRRGRRRAGRDKGRRDRGDLPEGCPEGFDWDFYKWIWNWPRDDRPQVLEKLAQTPATVVHLRSRADVKRCVESL
jgi:adenylate kinase family enzyme